MIRQLDKCFCHQTHFGCYEWMVKRDDVQCSERPSASISCDFCEGSDVVLQKEKNYKVRALGKLALL